MDTAFLICTEKPIEVSSVLLVQSIRDLGGSLANSPIYSFAPRHGYDISPWVRNAFKSLQVNHITEPLNIKYPDYPPGNKPFAAAYAESHLSHDKFIFCDSDKLVLNDLSGSTELGEYEIAVRPTHKKGVACTNLNDPNMVYWADIWKELGIVEPEIRVNTPVGQENVFGYWNSGLIVVKRNSGILSQWKQIMEIIRDKPMVPASNAFYLDQIALAAALHTRPSKVKLLPLGYNYPIHRHISKETPADNMVQHMKDLYSVHYHGLIRDPYFLNMFNSFDGNSEVKRWFKDQVDKYKIEPHCDVYKRSYFQIKMAIYKLLVKLNLR